MMKQKPEIVLSAAHLLVKRLSPFVRQIDFALDWVQIESGRAIYKKGKKFFVYFVLVAWYDMKWNDIICNDMTWYGEMMHWYTSMKPICGLSIGERLIHVFNISGCSSKGMCIGNAVLI